MNAISRLLLPVKPWIDLTRVDKFVCTMPVFWPFAWGLTMAARSSAMSWEQFSSTMIRVFALACVAHRKLDAQVERTKHRPVASGKISVMQALKFMLPQLAFILYLLWDVNRFAWTVALLGLLPGPTIYPLMKRITYWPQAFLGLTINVGILTSWAIATQSIPISSWILTAAAWSWTLWYDTIYGCQDKKDDVKAGVKSTSLLFGSRVKSILTMFGLTTIIGLLISGRMNHQSYAFFSISVIGGAMHLAWQLYRLDVDSPQSCWNTFEANGYYFGAIVEIGLLIDYLLITGKWP